MTFSVQPNTCRCHPETCCCNDWAVVSDTGEKHSSHYTRDIADIVCEAINKREEQLAKTLF